MGKLHSLRRAIVRSPSDWYALSSLKFLDYYDNTHEEYIKKVITVIQPNLTGMIVAGAAWDKKDGWQPNFSFSYVSFVKSVLTDIGEVTLVKLQL